MEGLCEERGAVSGIRLNYDRDLTLSYSPREFLHTTTVNFTFTGLLVGYIQKCTFSSEQLVLLSAAQQKR